MYFLVYILIEVSAKNGHLEVNPFGKDVGNKSIGGFAQGKGNGNHVPRDGINDICLGRTMTNPTMAKTVAFQGMPGNCSDLPTSSTLGGSSQMKSGRIEGEKPEGEGHEVSSNAASPRNNHCESVHPEQKS